MKNKDFIRIIGIDPGIATLGFGIIDKYREKESYLNCGVITTSADLSLSDRLMQIYEDLNRLIKTFNPDVVAIEELFFNTNAKTAISVAQGRGVAILAFKQSSLPIYEYTPLQVKQAVVGYGRADKRQIMEMVKRLLSLTAYPKPDDAADALAVALCHSRSSTSLLHKIKGEGPCFTI